MMPAPTPAQKSIPIHENWSTQPCPKAFLAKWSECEPHEQEEYPGSGQHVEPAHLYGHEFEHRVDDPFPCFGIHEQWNACGQDDGQSTKETYLTHASFIGGAGG